MLKMLIQRYKKTFEFHSIQSFLNVDEHHKQKYFCYKLSTLWNEAIVILIVIGLALLIIAFLSFQIT